MNKNLKKVISAVAALAISASAVSAFAVNFPDVPEDASYAQAVQELSALGVVSGFEDGTFRPDELVTRAQMAKFIVDALAETEQADASKANTQFNDVSADHWAKGYINQGVSDGFISGYSSTEFGPDDNVTYVQAQSMLVRAIGYQTYAEGSGGWPNGYKTWAASQGITDGISGIADDTQLTRAQVAQLVDNAMGAPVCVIKDYETTYDGRKVPNLEIKDGEGKDYQTLFTKMHDAYKVYGRVTNTNKTDSSVATDQVEYRVEKADNFDDEYIKTNSGDEQEIDAYYGDTNAVDLLRTYTQALIQQNDDDEWVILSITPAAANKSVTLAAEDFDFDKSDANPYKLYFYPAGTTKNSTKYAITDDYALYVNGKSTDLDYDALIAYIDEHDTAAVTLQKETKIGSTSTESDYNLIQITSYATAIVSDVIAKADQVTINFDDQSPELKGNMKVYLDDDNYTYDFTLDGETIDPADLQEDDVLSIAYDLESFADSSFYDVLVSRDTAEGKCTTVSSDQTEYTIGGTKYKIAEGMNPTIETSTEYTLYLDHFGRIAKVEEDSVNKKIGILKNVYKKNGGDWIAQIITKEGTEIEYKMDADKAEAAQTGVLGLEAAASDGVTYDADHTKVDNYPNQVIEYSVATSSNKLTVKSVQEGLGVADTEYKVNGTKIGSLKLGDSSVIIDISEADDDDEIKVLSVDNLSDGNDYSGFGYDRTTSGDRYYRFALITKGTSSFNSETQLAVFNGSELVDIDDDERTAFNVFIDGEEKQIVLKDSLDADDYKFEEGDALLFTTNAAGEITDIQPVFSAVDMVNGKTWAGFYGFAVPALQGVLAEKDWNALLSDGKSDDMDIVFGVVVNKSSNQITLCETLDEDKYANYDTGLDLDCRDAIVYAYDFAASSKNSRVFTDNGLQATPDYKSYKTTNAAGNDILDITGEDIVDDVVFAVARVDDDEVKEIYLIINED